MTTRGHELLGGRARALITRTNRKLEAAERLMVEAAAEWEEVCSTAQDELEREADHIKLRLRGQLMTAMMLHLSVELGPI